MSPRRLEPRIARSITLQLKGDWGGANLHKICGWLSQEILDRTGPHSRVAIWSGQGGVDEALAVGRGEVDIGIAVPTAFVPMALKGSGPFLGEAFPEIRALGTMPQDDRLVVAVKAEHEIRSFAELRRKKPAIRIATGPDDGVNTIGYFARLVLEESGISGAKLDSWGGVFVVGARPSDCVRAVMTGHADAIVHEAIMTARWQELANACDLHFLPIEERVLKKFESAYQWKRATLPKGYLRGIDRKFITLDFSDFLIICRRDLPDDIAYLIAWILCERRAVIESQYQHIPAERSPLTYPLVPEKIARTTIALHEGAERFYRDIGALTKGKSRAERSTRKKAN